MVEVYAIEKSSQGILNCIELIEENINEDVDLYFYSCSDIEKRKVNINEIKIDDEVIKKKDCISPNILYFRLIQNLKVLLTIKI